MLGNQQGFEAIKNVLANTVRKRLNISRAVNPMTFEPTIVQTQENCCAEVVEVFLDERKQRYFNATSMCIILDNSRYKHSCLLQQKAKALSIVLHYLIPYSPNLNLLERK